MQAWVQATKVDTSLIVLNSGNHELVCVRHRKSQTLFVSDVIEPHNCTNPGYGKLHVGICIAAILDMFDRKAQQNAHADSSGEGSGGGNGGGSPGGEGPGAGGPGSGGSGGSGASGPGADGPGHGGGKVVTGKGGKGKGRGVKKRTTGGPGGGDNPTEDKLVCLFRQCRSFNYND